MHETDRGKDTRMDPSLRSELLKIENVVGMGVAKEHGRIITVVMLRRDDSRARAKIAKLLKGDPYKIVITGKFDAREVSES
jgi:hypothetical protein